MTHAQMRDTSAASSSGAGGGGWSGGVVAENRSCRSFAPPTRSISASKPDAVAEHYRPNGLFFPRPAGRRILDAIGTSRPVLRKSSVTSRSRRPGDIYTAWDIDQLAAMMRGIPGAALSSPRNRFLRRTAICRENGGGGNRTRVRSRTE